MRILVANHHLCQWRGSERFTVTLVKELVRRGHEVHVYACLLGAVAQRLSRISRLLRSDELSWRRYDLALISHNTCQAAFENRAPVVMTCHGTVPLQEQPVTGADAYVAVSEEVQDHLRARGFSALVIRNAVDCEDFRPTRPLSPTLRRVLLLSNYTGAVDGARAACEMVGAEFEWVGGPRSRADVAGAINAADLVVTVGRGVYESLACGRNVVVFDRRDYDPVQGADGFATPDTLPEMLRCNCSGRARALDWGVDELAGAFQRYDPRLGEANRAFALEHFNVRSAVKRYLELP